MKNIRLQNITFFLLTLFLSMILFLSCNLSIDEKVYHTWIRTTINGDSYEGAVAVIIKDENIDIDATVFVTENNTVSYYYSQKKDYPTDLHITIKKVDLSQVADKVISYSILFSTIEYDLYRKKNDTNSGVTKQFKKKEGTVGKGKRQVEEVSFDDVN